MVAAAMGLVMRTWMMGRRAISLRAGEQGIAMTELAPALALRSPVIVDGTAIFLTQDSERAPPSLLHNLKHNKALHRRNLLLFVRTAQSPHVTPEERLTIDFIDDRFSRVTLRYGYMDAINVPNDLTINGLLEARGGVSFFVARNVVRLSNRHTMPHWIGLFYMFLHRNSADPTSFFAIPAVRVVELGSQIEL